MTLAPAIAEDAARPLQGEVLIAAWERGSELPAALRALPLLAAGCGLDERQAAAMDVPRRDAALLAVRRCSFGDALHGFATCDACGERLEFALSVAEVVDQIGNAARHAGTARHDDWSFECRFATIGDIEAAAREADLEAGREVLLARCVSVLDANGRAIGFADLDDLGAGGRNEAGQPVLVHHGGDITGTGQRRVVQGPVDGQGQRPVERQPADDQGHADTGDPDDHQPRPEVETPEPPHVSSR